MRIVRLPKEVGSTIHDAQKLRILLRSTYNIETQQAFPVALSNGETSLFLRISAAEYNTMTDYIALKNAVLSIVSKK